MERVGELEQAEDISPFDLGWSSHLVSGCIEFLIQPSLAAERRVSALIERVEGNDVGKAHPEYFVDADDAAKTCGRVTPQSSQQRLVKSIAQSLPIGCLFGAQGAFNASLADVMDQAKIVELYWGDDAPFSLDEFEDGQEFCEWLWREDGALYFAQIETMEP